MGGRQHLQAADTLAVLCGFCMKRLLVLSQGTELAATGEGKAGLEAEAVIGEGIHTQLLQLAQSQETIHEKQKLTRHNEEILLQTPTSCQHKDWAFRSSPFPNRQLLYQDMLETGLKAALMRLLRISLKSSHLKKQEVQNKIP
ncbi:hypothetical protein EK904_014114 [Melospiza melodia maxima]|nr:hypothetical protein EK904_014114 [Melospiza melodia maxima]